jgi:excisionase family DNA binding protein
MKDASMIKSKTEILREPLLDAEQTGILLGISKASVYEYIRRGELPYIKVGRHVRIIKSDLEETLIERRGSI